MANMPSIIQGAGLGLRREFSEQLLASCNANTLITRPDFIEIAPENWLHFGGRYAQQLAQLRRFFPIACHGLSLSIGGPQPINVAYVRQLAQFFDSYDIQVYSEHLSYTQDSQGYLYDLMPIPMTKAAVDYVCSRIQQVQDILQRPLILENVSTYLMPNSQMAEADFVSAVVQQSGCQLLLDVNNVYVNHINHASDAHAFIRAMPTEAISYVHIAGHYTEQADLLVDTHGDAVCAAVWDLLDYTYQCHGVLPTLLERDFNIPPLEQLLTELAQIASHQQTARSMLSVRGCV